MKQITIVLADEQSASRQKLRSLLESEPGLQVVGEINNGLDALDIVGNINPDIIVFNLNASNNHEILRLINLRHPKTAIIIPFKIENEKHVQELLKAGEKAYILKEVDGTDLAEVIRYINANENSLSALPLRQTAQNDNQKIAEYIRDPIDMLTAREREVFELLISDMTNAQIATRLSISRRTVEIHRARILNKLGLRNQYKQLLTYAVSRGIPPKVDLDRSGS